MNTKQVLILKLLEKKNGQRYSQLYKHFVPEDKFPYHLKHLIQSNFVYKEDGAYCLTELGLRESINHDSSDLHDRSLKDTLVAFVCKVGDKYIVREKLTSLSGIKCYYFPRGKTEFGESLENSCKRLFLKETGLEKAKFTYNSLHIKKQYSTKNILLFDNIFLFFNVELEEKDITHLQLRPGNKLMDIEEIKALEGKLPEVDILIFKKGWKSILEYSFVWDYI